MIAAEDSDNLVIRQNQLFAHVFSLMIEKSARGLDESVPPSPFWPYWSTPLRASFKRVSRHDKLIQGIEGGY